MRCFAVLILAATLLTGGCGRSQKAVEAEPQKAAEPTATPAAETPVVPMDLNKLLPPGEKALEDANYTEPTAGQKGFGMHARAENNVLFVSLKNQTGREVPIISKDFAILTGRDARRDLMFINPATADMKTFPAVMLADDQTLSFQLRLFTIPSAKGMALVYNNPRIGVKFAVPVE